MEVGKNGARAAARSGREEGSLPGGDGGRAL